MSVPTTPMTSLPAAPYTPARVPAHTAPMQPLVEIPTEQIYRLSVEQYHQMANAGILAENAPIELLDGWLVIKMTKHPPHPAATSLGRDALASHLPAGYYVRVQDPITLARSEPEPDLVVAAGSARDYLRRHPTVNDVPIVVEVAESSLDFDQKGKLAIYAAAKISSYWIVNLIGGAIEVYANPDGATYTTAVCYLPGTEVPIVIDGREVGHIPVNELLP